MFNLAQVVGNGSNQTLLTMSNLVEGNIHSTTIYNSTGSVATVTFTVGDKSFSFTGNANSNTSVDMTINVPVNSVVSVNAPTGVTVTSSYIVSPVDSTGALTAVQSLVDEASNYVATIPDGTINDTIVSTTDTWSSSKIDSTIARYQTLAQAQATALSF